MSTPLTAQPQPALGDYFVSGIVLALWSGALFTVVGRQAVPEPQAERLIGPMLALVALTALVWLGMVLARNLAILVGRASVAYYAVYVTNVPDEVIVRPARTFNLLMLLPNLVHVV